LTGSALGGTLITITGINFSLAAADNAIFFGPGNSNATCNVVSSSST